MLTPQTRILVLGASGRTGSLAVDYALSEKLCVVALARAPERVAPRAGLTIVAGTPAERTHVERAVAGCFAVVSFLGTGLGPHLPWSARAHAAGFLAYAIGNTVEAMKVQGVRRIVVLSAAGAGDSFAYTPRPWQLLAEHTGLRRLYAEHEAQEAVLQSSGLDWTAVRAVAFAGRKVRRTTLSYDGQPNPGLTISRTQVATFMIDCLGHPEFHARAPVVS